MVPRRFTHFVLLHTILSRRLPGVVLPPLPPKRYSGRFTTAFVDARTGDLQRYLNKLVRHPVARYAEILMAFLGCESDKVCCLFRVPECIASDNDQTQSLIKEWTHLLSHHLSLPAAGPSFYAQVYHPHFNVDTEDATDTIERFSGHVKAVGRGVQDLRGVYAKVRDARLGECLKHCLSSAYKFTWLEWRHRNEQCRATSILLTPFPDHFNPS